MAGTAAAAPYDADTVIVKFKPGASPTGDVLGKVSGLGATVLRVAGDPAQVAARLNRRSDVLYAEPNYILHALEIPNDARFGELYGLHQANDKDIDAPEGWDRAGGIAGTSGAKVGIVDTGIHAGHEDLAGKTVDCGGVNNFGILGLFADPTIVNGKCVDDNDHGTHVAGTIAAKANNGVGVAGVSPNSTIAACKALNSAGSGPTAGVANCITWLNQRGAKVISMSLGGAASTTMQNAVVNATNAGSLIIAAAGNNGNSTVSYPAGYPQVVSVAATDANDAKASFSNTNADVELAAAGVNVLSTKRGGGYVAFSGTSMATPHVAGVAAVVLGETGLTGTALRSRLTDTADDLGAAGRDTSFGFGRVNLNRALGG